MTKPVVSVEGVSKKFCRSLKRSLWYGLKDVGKDLLAWDRRKEGLRPYEFWAVDDVTFSLHPGESIGLIGANGAGKTTLLRLLSGLYLPDKGRIEIRGRVQSLISLGAGFIPSFTGRENIYLNGAILGMSRREIDAKFDAIVDFAELGDFLDAPLRSYSSGMVARLGFSIAAHVDPDVLLVDEVLAVGDIAFQVKCRSFMNRLLERGVSLVVVSHGFTMIQALCRQALWLDHGRVRRQGAPWEVYQEYKAFMLRPERREDEGLYETAGEVLSVRLFDAEGRETDELPFGKPWTAEVEIYGKMPVERVRLWLDIRHHDSVVGFASMMEEDLEFDLVPGRNVLRIHFQDLPLLPGERFEINTGLRDLTGGVYLVESYCRPRPFQVTGTAFPEAHPETVIKDFAGPVVIPHRWEGPVRRTAGRRSGGIR